LEISDCREKRSVVTVPEKKEQNDSDIELDGLVVGWRSSDGEVDL